jgi:hypothetical protein
MSEDRRDETYRRGRERFLEIHDEKALRTVEGLGDLGRHIVEFVYGEMCTRSLPSRTGIASWGRWSR